jgi:hypothetical protein
MHDSCTHQQIDARFMHALANRCSIHAGMQASANRCSIHAGISQPMLDSCKHQPTDARLMPALYFGGDKSGTRFTDRF